MAHDPAATCALLEQLEGDIADALAGTHAIWQLTQITFDSGADADEAREALVTSRRKWRRMSGPCCGWWWNGPGYRNSRGTRERYPAACLGAPGRGAVERLDPASVRPLRARRPRAPSHRRPDPATPRRRGSIRGRPLARHRLDAPNFKLVRRGNRLYGEAGRLSAGPEDRCGAARFLAQLAASLGTLEQSLAPVRAGMAGLSASGTDLGIALSPSPVDGDFAPAGVRWVSDKSPSCAASLGRTPDRQ